MTGAHSSYDGLLLSFKRRFARGLSAEANYTFSKEIDDSSEEYAFTDQNSNKNTQDPRKLRAGRGLGSFNRKDILSSNIDYNLPFGANLQGTAGRVVKGWNVAAILTAYSGFPVNVTESVDRSNDQ